MSQGADDDIHTPANDEAGAADMTDEQIWAQFDADDGGAEEDRDKTPGTDDADGAGDDGDQPDPSDDDQPADDEGEDADDGTEEEEDDEEPAAKIERLEHALKSERGRVSALQRKLERNRKTPATGDSPSRDANSRKEKLKEVAEEYGDILSPVVQEVEDLQKELDTLRTERTQAEQQEIDAALAEQEGLFLSEQPDGFDVIKDNADAFNGWIEDQPKRLRDLFDTNREAIVDGAGAALLVAHFKQALNPPPEPDPETEKLNSRRRHQLAGAQATRAAGRQSAVADTPPNTDDPDALWDYWDRKDREEARRNR